MIVLKGSREMFGLPEGSPYVTKTDVQLKMAGLAFSKVAATPADSPKGQLPFIEDDGQTVADSTFIRFHIEQEYGVDLDAGLDAVQRATALGVEMLCEHQLIPAAVYFRWLAPENFAKGPAHFFDDVPEHVRPQVLADVQGRVREAMIARGIARHSEPEIAALAMRALHAIAAIMGDRPYLMGEKPTGSDALVFASLAACLTPFFDTPVRDAALKFPTLIAYVSRMMDQYFPDFEWDAGVGATGADQTKGNQAA